MDNHIIETIKNIYFFLDDFTIYCLEYHVIY